MNLELLRSTFAVVRENADDVTRRFYDHLLNTYPQVRPLFTETDFASQRKKLAQSIGAVVAAADNADTLIPLLDKLGRSHKDYGVKPEQYPFVAHSLLATLAATFGEAWTAEAAETWTAALDLVSDEMIEAQARASA